MEQPLLEIDDLSIDFINQHQSITALENISFKVNKGRIVALVGESGSGKSVTSLAIPGLLPMPPAYIKNGNIFFYQPEKINLLKCSGQQLRKIRGTEIAMVFQEPMTSLNPVMTCGSQVAEAIRAHEEISEQQAKKRTIQLFEQVDLPQPLEIYDRYPHQLSGGQKQRVMIAMAMSCSPSLLICDEPTTALDVTVQKNILLLIRQLQQQNNMGVIFISHDLSVVANIADEIIVLYKGKIVEQGASENILKNPQHAYTKALLACRPASHSKNERLPVVSDFLQVNDPGKIDSRAKITHNPINEKDQLSPAFKKSNAILSVEDLKVWFPAQTGFTGKILDYVKAVDGVSFQIFEGEMLGLVGGSGSGKTTLGRAILQLIECTAGKVIFKGQDLTKATKQQLLLLRKDMQIIFQDPFSSLNPRLKIGDAVAEPLLVHHICNKKQAKENVMHLLEKVNLSTSFYHRYPHEFSGGQRQRIVIARSLALNPSFIICDESLSALDVSVQAQVLNLLNDLKKEFSFTALFISHDLSVVRYISDRIMVMNKGKIEETGDAEQVYYHPKSDYTRQLIDAIPKIAF